MPEAADKHLVVLMAGRRVGVIAQAGDGRLSMEYDEQWRSARDATPLSLSMPLARRTHDDRVVRSLLRGLLPDNDRVLERWARDYHVSAGNPFALLQHVGEDCAGAAQLVLPERVDTVLNGDGGITWLDEAEMAERLRVLRNDPASWHVRSNGQFSLAGAQAKTALFFDPATHRWGEPRGTTPTTAGPDAHAKNYSLLLSGNQVRLAPLYDIASALPYDDMYLPKLRMAMRIGGEYRAAAINARHWRRFAERNGLDPQETVARVDALAARTPECFAAASSEGAVQVLDSRLPTRLVERVTEQTVRCRTALARPE